MLMGVLFRTGLVFDPDGVAGMSQEGVEGAKVYVGNLSWGTESEDLGQLFAEFGSVEQADVVIDNTGRS
eukprot:5528708-Pyramimonas_sp.AAC.2